MPMVALQGVGVIRAYLNEVEKGALPLALENGATSTEIAEALGITRQAVHYKVRKLKDRGADQLSSRVGGNEEDDVRAAE
jgi:predicted transcriptional regulator